MVDSSRELSRIGENRLAVAVAIGSVAAAVVFGLLYWTGALDPLSPVGGPVADSIPLYLLFAVALIGLVLWGWRRLLSFFE